MSVLVALPGCRGPRAAAQCSGDRRAGPAHPAAPAAAAPARARAEHQVGPCAARASPHGVNKRMWQTDLGRAQLLHGRCMRLASCQRAAGWARRQGRRQRRLQRSACATASARGRTKDVPQWGLHGGRPGGLGPLQRSPHACWTPWRLPACAASQCARPGDRTLFYPYPARAAPQGVRGGGPGGRAACARGRGARGLARVRPHGGPGGRQVRAGPGAARAAAALTQPGCATRACTRADEGAGRCDVRGPSAA